jgi:tetratricopeptide (TPR) repeat protein
MAQTDTTTQRRFGRVAIVIAVVLAAAGIVLLYPRAEGYRHWRAAQSALRAEDFELARAELALARRARPTCAAYAYEAARAARRDGDLRASRNHLTAAAELGQPSDDIRLEESLAAVQQSGWRGHDEYLIALLPKRPADAARIREVLAHAFYGDLLLGTAVEHALAWVELEPWSGRAWQLLGEIKETSRDMPGAMEAYQNAVERNPPLVRAQVGYADALFRQLRTDEAVAHYRRALEANPGDRDARLGLTRAYVQLDRLGDAGPVIAALVADHPQDAEVLGLAGRVALLDNRTAEAESLLTRSLAKVRNLVVLQDLQATLARRGKVAEARAVDEQIASLRKDFDRLDRLTEVAQTSLAPGPRVEMGQILIRNGLNREGAAWLYDALRCAPGYRPAHAALADYHASRGETEQAEHHRRLAGSQ